MNDEGRIHLYKDKFGLHSNDRLFDDGPKALTMMNYCPGNHAENKFLRLFSRFLNGFFHKSGTNAAGANLNSFY
jgi:hypothetical protein